MIKHKKNLLITIDFPPQTGGVANYLANLTAKLPKDKIIVLANQQKNDKSWDDKHNFKIIRKNLYYEKFWPKWLKIFFIAKKIIKQQKIEQIIISHLIPIGYICLLLKLPFIVIIHGYDIMLIQKSKWKKFWTGIILKKAKHIIVNSNFTKQKVLQEKINQNKITVIYPSPNISPQNINETDKNLIIQELDLHNKKILLSVGRLVKRKGIDNVIKALPQILNKIPNLVYLIVGNGDYKPELEKLAEKLNIRGNIIFLQDISDTHLPNYFSLADIFIQPARIENNADAEGFGIVYAEANLFGKPVIAGNVGGAVEAIKHNQTGILVDPHSVSEIQNAIITLFNDPELMKSLGEQGRERVLAEFNLDKQLKLLEGII